MFKIIYLLINALILYQQIQVYFMQFHVMVIQHLLKLKKNYIKNIQNIEKQIIHF